MLAELYLQPTRPRKDNQMMKSHLSPSPAIGRGITQTRNFRSGPITRLISPDDLGETVKPFVFLDYFELNPEALAGFRPHPHSGIATHTTFLGGGMSYGDSTGKKGSLSTGSIEWMQAGGGRCGIGANPTTDP